ncbi:MAG TPA: hypothetical protein VKE92_11075, partial [Anaerolineales bacterium]|nr:hypothetical protein [Anaerolineales bacterium]
MLAEIEADTSISFQAKFCFVSLPRIAYFVVDWNILVKNGKPGKWLDATLSSARDRRSQLRAQIPPVKGDQNVQESFLQCVDWFGIGFSDARRVRQFILIAIKFSHR